MTPKLKKIQVLNDPTELYGECNELSFSFNRIRCPKSDETEKENILFDDMSPLYILHRANTLEKWIE